MNHFLGIDISKAKVDQLHACMEATGSYGEALTYEAIESTFAKG